MRTQLTLAAETYTFIFTVIVEISMILSSASSHYVVKIYDGNNLFWFECTGIHGTNFTATASKHETEVIVYFSNNKDSKVNLGYCGKLEEVFTGFVDF